MEENRKTFQITDEIFATVYSNIKDIPSDVIIPNQCHGSNLVEIITGKEDLSNCDALITSKKDFKLGIKTADCAAVCFTDGKKIGIAHIGWRGLCLSLIEKMLMEFEKENLSVFVGPFYHNFELKKDFCFDKIKEKFGEKYLYEKDGKLTFSFKDAIMSLLPEQTIFDSRNTFTDISLPSFRRDKTLERLAVVLNLK